MYPLPRSQLVFSFPLFFAGGGFDPLGCWSFQIISYAEHTRHGPLTLRVSSPTLEANAEYQKYLRLVDLIQGSLNVRYISVFVETLPKVAK
jgi:hypothetical protein